MRGVDGDADARGDLELSPLERRRELRQEPDEVVGLEGRLGGGRVGGEEAELVASQAGEDPARPEGRAESLAEAAQVLVSGGEPVRVVQGLEVVEVEEEERERAGAVARLDRLLEDRPGTARG